MFLVGNLTSTWSVLTIVVLLLCIPVLYKIWMPLIAIGIGCAIANWENSGHLEAEIRERRRLSAHQAASGGRGSINDRRRSRFDFMIPWRRRSHYPVPHDATTGDSTSADLPGRHNESISSGEHTPRDHIDELDDLLSERYYYDRTSMLSDAHCDNVGFISITNDKSLEELESLLNTLIRYIVRDFVKSWFRKFSNDQVFVRDVRDILRLVLQRVFKRSQEIDWTLFWATVPLEKLHKHMSTIRKSRMNAASHTAAVPRNYEKYYRLVMSALMAQIMPEKIYNTKLVHLVLRDVLIACAMTPAFDYVTDPDYVNQWLCWVLAGNDSNDSFILVLKQYATTDELRSVKALAHAELDKLNSADSVGNDLKVKRQIGAISELITICKQKLLERGKALYGASEDKEAEEIQRTKRLYKFLESQGRLSDVYLLFFDQNAENLQKCLQGKRENSMDERKYSEAEEQLRSSMVAQFFDKDHMYFLGDYFREKGYSDYLPTSNIETISSFEILNLRKKMSKEVDGLWCEYQNAVRITEATIIQSLGDDHYEIQVTSGIEECWTAKVKFQLLENLHDDLKKLKLDMTRGFPGRIRNMFNSKIKQINELNLWLEDVIRQVMASEDSVCDTGCALLAQTLKVPRVRPSSLNTVIGSSPKTAVNQFGIFPGSPKSRRRPSDEAESSSRAGSPKCSEPSNDSCIGTTSGPSRVLIDIVVEAFKLCDNKRWLRRQIHNQLYRLGTSLIQSKSLNRPILETVMHHLTSYKAIVAKIKQFLDLYWPNGNEFTVSDATRSRDDRLRTAVLTKSRMLATIPDQVKLILGSQDCRDASLQFIQLFQNREDNMLLLLEINENILDVMFPQVNWSTFRKVL